MSDYLSSFKRRRISATEGSAPNVVLQLDEAQDGRSVLKILDEKGLEVLPDYRRYQGPLFSLLRYAHTAQSEMGRKVSWGGFSSELMLDEHPQLMRYLPECDALLDKDGAKVLVCPHLYALHLEFKADGDFCLPVWTLSPEKDKSLPSVKGFRLLTDSYAMTENHQLVELLPLGENYHLLKDLQQKIPQDQAELFISVMLSSYDHLQVEGCVWEETPVSTRPTLVFEKVDEEKSLYLRVTESLPGVSMQFLEDFSPSVLAGFTPEGQLRAQKIAYSDTAALLKDVRRSIAACASSRQAAKEVYEDDGFFILPAQVAESFLIGHLAALARDYVLLGADKLGVFRIRKATPKLRISSFSGIDFLEGKAELELEGETLSLADFLSQYRQSRYVQIAGGDRLIVDADYVERLERLVSPIRMASMIGRAKPMIREYTTPIVAASVTVKMPERQGRLRRLKSRSLRNLAWRRR